MPMFYVQRPQKVVGQLPAWIQKQLPITNFQTVERYALRDTLQQYDPVVPLNHDPFMDSLNDDDMQAHIDGLYRTPGVGAMNRYGIGELGAPPDKVTVNPAEPIKDSTMLAVVGGSVLAVAASVALWAYFGKRK